MDGVVSCPWHGFRYDAATGACLVGSGLPGVRRHEVRIENGRILVEV